MSEHRQSAVAIIADAHFHDIHSDYDGAGLRIGNERLALRSWADTRSSTRVFNESAAALTATLDQILQRGIKHVVMLGDYTDDGQVESTTRVAGLLARYRDRFGLRFYALPGNHDAFGPVGKNQSTRFVTGTNKSVLITSDPKVAKLEPESAILTQKMRCLGLPDALMPMAKFGYFNAPDDIHWETPFGSSDAVEDRMYTAVSDDGTVSHSLMDASYLIEPEHGLWLLMIDANVFEPRSGSYRIDQKQAFIDSTDAGWNAVMRIKPFLVDWIKDVCRRADQNGKSLLAFSHYPAIDPFDDATDTERALFGNTEIVRRRPDPTVADILIRAGLRHHFSGHYHVNAHTSRQIGSHTFTNISVPSPVAYPSGFAIAQPNGPDCTIDTISLTSVPLDPRVMAVYSDEADRIGETRDTALDSPDYGSFLYDQMHSRTLHHVLPKKWPKKIANAIHGATAADLGALFLATSKHSPRLPYEFSTSPIYYEKLAHLASRHDIGINDLRSLALTTLVADWYCLRQAGPMPTHHIPNDHAKIYQFLIQIFSTSNTNETDSLVGFFSVFLNVMDKYIG